MQITDENKNYIAHSVLAIGKTKAMIAANIVEMHQKYKVGHHTSLCIQSAD